MRHAPARLYLVRHGETDWNRQRRFQGTADIPLNDLGRAQSRALAERLADARFDAVYTSPLSRAAETARIVAERHGVAPIELPDLRERDMGVWSGLTYDEVRERHAADLARMEAGEDAGFGGGESLVEVHARMTAALGGLGVRHSGQSVLVVSHGLALKTALCALLGLELRHAHRLTTGGNTGLTVFERHDVVARTIVYGCTRHLDEARIESHPSK